MENLYIDGDTNSELVWNIDDIGNTKWLDLLLPFTSVKNLYLSERLSSRIVLVLQELVGGRTTKFYPLWRMFSWKDSSHQISSIKAFRGSFLRDSLCTNHPVVISVWHKDPWDISWEVDD
jgi:hypothetical protein